MGHGYFTVLGLGYLIDHKTFVAWAKLEFDPDNKYSALDRAESWMRKEYGLSVHREGQGKGEKVFLSFTKCEKVMDARGANGEVRRINILEFGSNVTEEERQNATECLKNEIGLTQDGPNVYLFSYEGC